MDKEGLWRLFFATGSPLVWLAIRRLEQEEEQAVSAFGDLDIPIVEL